MARLVGIAPTSRLFQSHANLSQLQAELREQRLRMTPITLR